MLLLFLATLMALTSVGAQSVNCASFWPITPGAQQTVDHPCIIFSGFPTIFSNTITGTFAYYAEWQNDPSLPQLAEPAGQALADGTCSYTSLQANIADIVVILTNETDGIIDARTYRYDGRVPNPAIFGLVRREQK